ncbi:hypothetical protein [Flammeovirga pacifica]|uniref:Uncharacterized protein n=1 Tax=Flammeovirga pacifica TaxID=915059 RepID=A0A1S1YSV9_FLAPC|nr:hypothetical protein [Flammeovirga pacifica]OHX64098.1 hypothetical protein NH26_21055 [Flammeovirga pacifica]
MENKSFSELVFNNYINFYLLSLFTFLLGVLFILVSVQVGFTYSSFVISTIFGAGSLAFLSIGLINSYVDKLIGEEPV